jgi:Putative Flp pilus-assembly TadE/G-like
MTRALQQLRRRIGRDDDGQLLLLMLAYTVIAALLITVVVDVSQTYLYRRSLLAAADAAALSAANQPDLGAVYAGDDPAVLPLSQRGALRAVEQYAEDAELADRFRGFEVVTVDTDGAAVTVTLRAVVHLPFAHLVPSRWQDGYPVEARANARSPLVP